MTKIGLEIHGYLATKEKLFCGCKNVVGIKDIKPNTFICPICCGYPGSKPLFPNYQAIKNMIKIALMLNCKINKKAVWQRKHYDWPDLPKGYQDTISGSYSIPNATNGEFLNIKIREIHLEEDPAAWNPKTGEIDYNRSGSPLIEIVTEPDFKSARQVSEWLKQLVLILDYIKAIDKNAGLKADVNVSTSGERVEIKNINSRKNIIAAINYEINRQQKLKSKTKRETRRWDDKKLKTILMRTKEQAADYKFIPEPNLPIINLEQKQINGIKLSLPESPQQKLQKIIKKYKIKEKYAKILASNLEIVELFEKVSEKISPEFALDWVIIELLRVLNYNKTALDQVDIKPKHFIELLQLAKNKKITETQAKRILNKFIPKSFSPLRQIKGKEKIDSKSKITEFCKKTIKQNPKAVKDYKSGNLNAINFLIGQVMKLSQGRADYKTAREIMLRLLA